MQELKIKKEFKELIPPLSQYEQEGLEAEIRYWARCYSPIITWRGYIADGHHRYAICQKHKLPFKTEELNMDDEDDVMIWMIDNQKESRRNIETPAKIRLGLKRESILSKKAEKRMKSGGYEYKGSVNHPSPNLGEGKGKVTALIAKDIGVARGSIEKFKYIEENAPDLADDLCAGKVVDGKKLSIDGSYRDLRKKEREDNLKASEFPRGKYRVIYADPPWEYGPSKGPGGGDAEDEYPTMSFDGICQLPVKEISDETAVLFLWVTTPLIQKGLDVMKAWGFDYKTLFTWDKVRSFFGHYNAVAQEFLLLGTKGSCLPDCNTLPHSVVRVKRGRHSEKPEEFRQIIETLYKYGNKVELFARKQTEGWEVYGNECK